MEAETRALCAVHPERPADAGICSRCGTFVCAECVAPGTLPAVCLECQKRAASSPLVRQVPALGITMMVHGGLVLVVGVFLVIYGVSLAISFGSMPEPTGPVDPDRPDVRTLEGVMMWSMLGLGAILATIGALQIFGGFRVRAFRGRALGIAALWAGLGATLSCYCAPTAIALLVWGLVVLLGRPVTDRFAQIRRSATTAS